MKLSKQIATKIDEFVRHGGDIDIESLIILIEPHTSQREAEIEVLREFATHKPGCYENGDDCICGLDALLAGKDEPKSLSDIKDKYFPNRTVDELRAGGENQALREYISAVLEEAFPIIHLHQVRNINHQTQFPRCKKAWANIPEDVRFILKENIPKNINVIHELKGGPE